jgi:hypothetical protein
LVADALLTEHRAFVLRVVGAIDLVGNEDDREVGVVAQKVVLGR